MKINRFVITGCGRSGTTYISRVLTRLGIHCGHERIFRMHVVFRLREVFRIYPVHWHQPPYGDSSWLAAPFLDRLPMSTIVFHQVRHPLAVIHSHLRIQFFEKDTRFTRFAYRNCKPLREGSEVERCLRYWFEWNKMVERAMQMPHLQYYRYRIEDVDFATIRQMLELVGGQVSESDITRALTEQSTATNTRGNKHSDSEITWAGIPSSNYKECVAALAEAYGYNEDL